MHEHLEYTIEGKRRVCSFTRADRFWGHGLRVKIFDEVGFLLNEATFFCHPEQTDYDQLQAKETDELIAIAIKRLSSGLHEEALEQAPRHGLKLFLTLSAIDAPSHS